MTVLRSIPAPAEALLGSSALAHLVTRNRDGTPQVSVVWCGVRGDQVFFCAEGSTAKVRNILRDGAVVLSIEDEARNLAGTQQHLLVYGTAQVVDGPADRELCDELCRTYVGRADHELNLGRSSTAVTVMIDVERIGGNGPWTFDD
jgi:PPOX class probable F420-dependent enzyme